MFVNLWLLNTYLIANALGFLAFFAFAWLYLDTYRRERVYRHNLIRAIGGFLIGGGFLAGLLENLVGETHVVITPVQLVLLNFGIAFTVMASFLEPVPLLPSLDKTKSKKQKKETSLEKMLFSSSHSFLRVVTSVISLFLPFIGTSTIAMQTHYKVKFGLSKEFKGLIYVWWFMSIYMLLSFLNIAFAEDIVWIDELTRAFSGGWLITQLIAIGIAIAIFFWVYTFLSFRVFAKMFLSIWQIAIFISVLIASIYSIITITSVENQIVDLLGNNVELVSFNIDQIRENNEDLLAVLASNSEIKNSLVLGDNTSIEHEAETFIYNNQYLDQVIITDRDGQLIFNSDNPTLSGVSLLNNQGVLFTVENKDIYQDFLVANLSTTNKQLVYQNTVPVMDDVGNMIGTITTVKKFDDLYLDILKNQTEQELIIYIDNRRSASTLIPNNEIRRLENLPHFKGTDQYNLISSEDSEAEYGRATIYTTQYYTAILPIRNSNNEFVADIVVANEQAVLIKTNERALINTFLFAVLVSILATIPSYTLAKSLEKNLNV